jgi:hypothetical protein
VIAAGVVEAFVVNAFRPKNHAKVTRLGQEGLIVPEAIEIDVRLQRP